MKKLLAVISVFFVIFSFTACSKNEVPPVDERAQALLTGEITVDEMEEKGWIDEDLINYLDSSIGNKQNLNASENSGPYLGDFSAEDLQGNEVKSDIFSQYDLTLVNLWTTNCGYCIEEMPYLEEIKNELAENGKSFNVIGICLDVNSYGKVNGDKLEKAQQIIDATGVTYTNILPDEVIWENKAVYVSAVPESFFVDSEGKLVGETILGAKNKDSWLSAIEDKFNELEGK